MKKSKVALVSTVVLAGLTLAAAPASAATGHPASGAGTPGTVRSLAADPGGSGSGNASTVTTCGDPQFGGKFYCGGPYGSGSTFFTSRDGTRLILVVGTNHAVFTRSTIANSTRMTDWTSLGGNMAGKVEITAQTAGGAFRIDVPGADGRNWSRARDTDGSWTPWVAR
ncbi:hypothetical protein [Kitasatospora sp. NPDC018619]|uniref:hypothetical protein n=1 Tax=unclassified Kitasatospora TaxID=2633591 RepID=UPI0037B95F55